MNEQPICSELLPVITSDFGKVFRCRRRGETLEVQTPFQTRSGKMVSVFISIRDGQYIVSDGGWLAAKENPYNIARDNDDEPPAQLIEHALEGFKVKTFTAQSGETFYFKACKDKSLISACINDVAHLVIHYCASIENAYLLHEDLKTADPLRMRFTAKANVFIKLKKPADASLEFSKKLDDLKGVSFSAALTRVSSLTLITYVTGSSFRYFRGEVTRSNSCYEALNESKWNDHVRNRLVLLDDDAGGYRPDRISTFTALLTKKLSHPPILWSKRDEIEPFLS